MIINKIYKNKSRTLIILLIMLSMFSCSPITNNDLDSKKDINKNEVIDEVANAENGTSNYETVSEDTNKKNETINYETTNEEANIKKETGKRKTKGHPVYNTEFHNSLYDKRNVITAGGGGGLGEGGGAIKKSGKTAGKNTDIKDAGDNLNDPKSSKEENNRDDSINETYGRAEDEGEFYKETEGKNAGKKIFEFDRNGNVGIDNNHAALEKGRSLMRIAVGLAFSVGIVSFLLASRDSKKKKNNYF